MGPTTISLTISLRGRVPWSEVPLYVVGSTWRLRTHRWPSVLSRQIVDKRQTLLSFVFSSFFRILFLIFSLFTSCKLHCNCSFHCFLTIFFRPRPTYRVLEDCVYHYHFFFCFQDNQHPICQFNLHRENDASSWWQNGCMMTWLHEIIHDLLG